MSQTKNARTLVTLLFATVLLSCGGGSNDAGAPVAVAPAVAPPPPPPPAPPIPPMAQPPHDVTGMTAPVGMDYWGDNSNVNGGKRETIDGIPCLAVMDQTYHVHTHLAIVLNGQLLQIPEGLGQVPGTPTKGGCFYEIHNHDKGGRLHMEAAAPADFRLGSFFKIWGQPLSRDNVGGITGLPVVVYVTDNGVVTRWDDDPGAIELTSHRLITIQIGTQLTELPNFAWTGT